MTTQPPFWTHICVKGRNLRLETQWVAPERTASPIIVFLHEGLGSVARWGKWPQQLCNALGYRGLVFSRYGYGRSTPRATDEEWPVGYLHQEATEMLPTLLRALNVDVALDRPFLFGHSDGGSIALIHAALFPESVAGIIAVAPHIFIEDIGIARIKKLRQDYIGTDMLQKLGRYHDNFDLTFRGWSDLWLNSGFRNWRITSLLPHITCPILAIQGESDEYGTLEQIYGLRRCVPHAELLVLRECRHAPHQDRPQALTERITHFLRTF